MPAMREEIIDIFATEVVGTPCADNWDDRVTARILKLFAERVREVEVKNSLLVGLEPHHTHLLAYEVSHSGRWKVGVRDCRATLLKELEDVT